MNDNIATAMHKLKLPSGFVRTDTTERALVAFFQSKHGDEWRLSNINETHAIFVKESTVADLTTGCCALLETLTPDGPTVHYITIAGDTALDSAIEYTQPDALVGQLSCGNSVTAFRVIASLVLGTCLILSVMTRRHIAGNAASRHAI